MDSKILLVFVLLAGASLGAWARGAISGVSDTSANPSGAAQINTADHAAISAETVDNSSGNTHNLHSVIVRMQAELDEAQDEHGQLRLQIEGLEEQLARLSNHPAKSRVATASASDRIRRRGAGALTLETLTEAGISERDAAMMKNRLDELSMQRLYLRDQALREGWVGKKQYRDEIRRINNAQTNLENEFGQENYARYLYAMGRPNRVSVQSVIANSPAYNAGVQNGDQVISYGDSRIYNAGELSRGTQQGVAGELVPLVVERNGQRMDLYVPRGPLGVTMDSDSVRPDGSSP